MGKHNQLTVEECGCGGAVHVDWKQCIYTYGDEVGHLAKTLDDCDAAVKAEADKSCKEKLGADASVELVNSCVFDVCFYGTQLADQWEVNKVQDAAIIASNLGGGSAGLVVTEPPQTAGDPHNCMTKEMWGPDKTKWCCEEKKIGCETGSGSAGQPCCWQIGFGAMMKPCCYKDISCSEFDAQKDQPIMGGSMGKTDKCPADADEAKKWLDDGTHTWKEAGSP